MHVIKKCIFSIILLMFSRSRDFAAHVIKHTGIYLCMYVCMYGTFLMWKSME